MVSLSVSPVDDTILSGSLDRTARLWDLRAPDCLGLMQCQVRLINIERTLEFVVKAWFYVNPRVGP